MTAVAIEPWSIRAALAASGRAPLIRRSALVVAPRRGGLLRGTLVPMPPTVLIVDDHPAFRSLARALLESEGFAVVGEAEDGAAAMSAVEALRPDVVLLDIQLPDLDGFEVAERLAGRADAPAVVLVSTRTAAAYGARLETAAARGFIPKTSLSGAALAALVS